MGGAGSLASFRLKVIKHRHVFVRHPSDAQILPILQPACCLLCLVSKKNLLKPNQIRIQTTYGYRTATAVRTPSPRGSFVLYFISQENCQKPESRVDQFKWQSAPILFAGIERAIGEPGLQPPSPFHFLFLVFLRWLPRPFIFPTHSPFFPPVPLTILCAAMPDM